MEEGGLRARMHSNTLQSLHLDLDYRDYVEAYQSNCCDCGPSENEICRSAVLVLAHCDVKSSCRS